MRAGLQLRKQVRRGASLLLLQLMMLLKGMLLLEAADLRERPWRLLLILLLLLRSWRPEPAVRRQRHARAERRTKARRWPLLLSKTLQGPWLLVVPRMLLQGRQQGGTVRVGPA
jgi:hypothetical protein